MIAGGFPGGAGWGIRSAGPGPAPMDVDGSTAGQETCPFFSSLGTSPQESLAQGTLPVSIRTDEE